MKVKVEFTVDVDLHAMALEYGVSIQEARTMVCQDAQANTINHLQSNGLLTQRENDKCTIEL